MDANSSGDTFLSISNNSISQIWKWDGKYLANPQNVKNKLCLYSSLKSSSQNQRWTIFGRTLKDFKIMTPELFWMLCSKSTQEPGLEFFCWYFKFFFVCLFKIIIRVLIKLKTQLQSTFYKIQPLMNTLVLRILEFTLNHWL